MLKLEDAEDGVMPWRAMLGVGVMLGVRAVLGLRAMLRRRGCSSWEMQGVM